MMIQALIIDDEPLAHKVIENYAKQIPYLHLVHNCYQATEAIPVLNKQKVDLIFLDINMPNLKGTDFLKMLLNPPAIIITSAHQEYALEGFELQVNDYLLKPFTFERFFRAIQKVYKDHAKVSPAPLTTPTTERTDRIFIKSDKKHYQIKLADIQYLKAYGSYTWVLLADQKILANHNLAYFEQKLSTTNFLRIHKSYLVNLDQIDLLFGNQLRIGETDIPIGEAYRLQLKKEIRKRG